MKIILLLSLTLVSCGKMNIDDLIFKYTDYKKTEHKTNPIFNEYLDILNLNNTTPIIFNKRKSGIAGTCTKYNNYRVIEIDPTYWNNMPESNRLVLLAHEIGHCDYNLDHNTNVLENGCFESIMYPMNFGGDCWDNHKEYYMSNFYN